MEILTEDGTWRDLNLSSVVPAGAISVLLHVGIRYPGASGEIMFRENGNSYDWNTSNLSSYGAGLSFYGDFVMKVDGSRIIEYKASASPTVISITVGGWWI